MSGLIVVGIGFAVQGAALKSEIDCQFQGHPASCQSAFENAANSTVLAQYAIGGGSIALGTGFFLVAWTVIATLARRAEERSVTGPISGMAAPPPPPWPPAP